MDGEQNAAQGQAEGGQNQQTNTEPTEGRQGAPAQEDEGADKAAEAYKTVLAERDVVFGAKETWSWPASSKRRPRSSGTP